MTEAYDLRSNIKGKPGSQGTLFQVKDKSLLNPAQRWPQGYTPERLNEVRGALKDTGITPFFAKNAGELTSPMGRERITKIVARSTVPASDLKGLATIHSQNNAGSEATYYPERNRYGVQGRSIGIDVSLPAHEKNLIHEIGHHVDFEHAKQADTMEGTTRNRMPGIIQNHLERKGLTNPNTTQIANVARDVAYGATEAYADNYYVKHYRSPGRQGSAPAQGRYEDNVDDVESRYPGYRDVRPAPHMGPQFQQGELW